MAHLSSAPFFLVGNRLRLSILPRGHRASLIVLHFCLIKLLVHQYYVSPQWLTQTLGNPDPYGPYPQVLVLKMPPGSHSFNPTTICDPAEVGKSVAIWFFGNLLSGECPLSDVYKGHIITS